MDNGMLRGTRLLAWLVLVALVGACDRPPTQSVQVEMPSDEQLRDRLDKAIEFNSANRHLNTTDHAAWQVVHGALMYGRDLQIYHDGKLVSALDYLLGGGQLRGWTMRKGDHGVQAVLEAGTKMGQGHPDQWLGYLSQCGLSPDDPIVVGGTTYKIRDLITQAQWDIYDGMEATWTLMAFSTYLPQDASWTAKDGTQWNIERMVRMETAQPLGDSACGGTHRMFGLTVAVNRYRAAGGKFSDNAEGTWEMANKKIQDAVTAARQFQQPDGSLSTNFFERPATSAEIDKRIGTTGHVLEFLMVALNDDEVREPWVTRAVVHLVGCLEKTQQFDLECGALYHAMRGLGLYRTRRFGARELTPPSEHAEPAGAQAATAASGAAVSGAAAPATAEAGK